MLTTSELPQLACSKHYLCRANGQSCVGFLLLTTGIDPWLAPWVLVRRGFHRRLCLGPRGDLARLGLRQWLVGFGCRRLGFGLLDQFRVRVHHRLDVDL